MVTPPPAGVPRNHIRGGRSKPDLECGDLFRRFLLFLGFPGRGRMKNSETKAAK
jgi:hypothetical protein